MDRFFSFVRSLSRRGWFAAALVLALVGPTLAVMLSPRNAPAPTELSYTAFSEAVASGRVAKAAVGNGLGLTLKDGSHAFVRLPSGFLDPSYLDRMVKSGIEVEIEKREASIVDVAAVAAPWALLILVFALVAMQVDLKGRLSWPAVARRVPDRFPDVAGQDEPKSELAELVTFLKDPSSFERVGARAPRGVLMVGPPGTGKTLLAKALAGEAGVSFIAVAGSEFSAPFVGVAKSRVARLFRMARRKAPCIVFIDEVDSIGKKRGGGAGAADREFDTTLNQLLVEMDGFSAGAGVIVVAATNRVDVLDPALLRPGRFDRQIHIGLPDVGGRLAILNVHASKVPLRADVDLSVVAKGTPGFSGADLANLINEAAVFAARQSAGEVAPAHLEAARNKITMGLARKSLVLHPDERRLVAVHEAGHALCASLLPASDAVHTATIVPHGEALGLVMRLPEADRFCIPLDKLKADLIVAMGGRAAEEEVFGPEKVTTGAAADIAWATRIASRMVTEWGLTRAVGMTRIETPDGSLPQVAEKEVRRITEESYAAARELVSKHRRSLDQIAESLLEKETLEGDEIRRIVGTAEEILTEAA